jgi:hypothetical protein
MFTIKTCSIFAYLQKCYMFYSEHSLSYFNIECETTIIVNM